MKVARTSDIVEIDIKIPDLFDILEERRTFIIKGTVNA